MAPISNGVDGGVRGGDTSGRKAENLNPYRGSFPHEICAKTGTNRASKDS